MLMYIVGGAHNHSAYATYHDIDEVRRECESKIEALDNEWKIRQFNWQHSVLSLIQQLYSSILGEYYIRIIMCAPFYWSMCHHRESAMGHIWTAL